MYFLPFHERFYVFTTLLMADNYIFSKWLIKYLIITSRLEGNVVLIEDNLHELMKYLYFFLIIVL